MLLFVWFGLIRFEFQNLKRSLKIFREAKQVQNL